MVTDIVGAHARMWKLLDRQMFLSYIKSYFVCTVSLLGLFVVVDLFTNLEDFMKAHDDFASRIRYIATYYAFNTAKNFDQISEAIVLMAAMFTVALMQRSNELLPLLSAGVSTRRAVLPALVGAMCMLGLSAANQELVLPHVDGFMVENRGDPSGETRNRGHVLLRRSGPYHWPSSYQERFDGQRFLLFVPTANGTAVDHAPG